MKKKKSWLAGMFIASVAAAMAVNINLKYDATADGRVFILTNADALAKCESGDWDCSGSSSVLCNGAYYKVKYTR